MAAEGKTSSTGRRVIFGRREKLVAIGALGLIAIGALHFLVFKSRSDALSQAMGQFQQKLSEYQQLTGRNYQEHTIRSYRDETQTYRQQLVTIVARENLAFVMTDDQQTRAAFRDRVRRLSRKWLAHNRTRGPDETNLAFIGTQSPDFGALWQDVQRGRILWNIPDRLPEGVTASVIRDNLDQAQGKLRLIQRLGNDPASQRDRQQQFNNLMAQLGINPWLLGADHINVTPERWQPWRLTKTGAELEEGSVPISPNQSLRLPVPLDAFSALAHIDLLLDTLYPPPFDEQTMQRAWDNPDSLSPTQREQFDTWLREREARRVTTAQSVGLEEMLDVHYSDRLVFYNIALDHVERLVDMAIEEGISQVLMIKILKDENLRTLPDPWKIPEPEEVQAPAAPQAPMQAPEFFAEFAGQMDAASYMAGMMTRAAQPQAPAEPEEPPFAAVAAINMRISGDYARVMTFVLKLSTGPNLYTLEEMTLAASENLPEGHIAADLWISAPLAVWTITPEIAQEAQQTEAGAGG